ncbi:MAG: hypothetical protein K6V36_11625 [Anaerolineae bacterium]|nr:hypothetical protein [Anaerolineae bacterium]
MNLLRLLWESTSITVEGLAALGALLVLGALILVLTLRVRLVRPFAVRPLAAAERVRGVLGRAMETGEPLHVALGIGGLGDVSTADTLAGLALVSFLADRGALAEVPVRVRLAQPTALVGALAALQRGAQGAGYPEAYDPAQAAFVAPVPLAYGAGTAEALRSEPPVANAMVGAFGAEVLLPAQAGGDQPQTVQVGGTSDPSVLPLLLATTDSLLAGEEIYALGAALGRADHTGSLAAQDLARALLVLGIVLGAVLALVIA